MTPVFSPDIIARVKDETDIVEVVRRHVDLKPAGSVLKGLCPFHKEKTPSFIVTPARQRYHCFGCGTGGDVFTFLMELEQFSFPEAVEVLARPLDIDLSAWLREDEGEGERRAFYRANEAASTIWQEAFWDDKLGGRARRYLNERGFGDKVLRDFEVGFAPSGGGWLEPRLSQAGVDPDLAKTAGLLRVSDRDGGLFAYFRERIIFPIKSISRQVAGFGGRVIDQGEPKYLNSSDNVYFTKGKLLYGFDASRMAIAREKTALLVEGYLDLLAVAEAGYTHVVATCGTAFTPDQARLVHRGAPRVKVLFDGDKAGVKAAVKAADTALKAGLEPEVVSLPAGEDPASLLAGAGREAFDAVLNDALGYVPFLKLLADRRGGGREVAERAVRQVLGTVAGITDPLRREYLLQETGEVFGLALDILRRSVPVAGTRPFRQETAAAEPPVADDDPPPGPEDAPPTRLAFRPRIQADKLETDLFLHVLRDDSGEAARVFLAEGADLDITVTAARPLVGELEAWAAQAAAGARTTPREFVEGRWNQTGDQSYRGFVSGLVNKEEFPAQTDFVKAVRDILQRLGQAARARR